MNNIIRNAREVNDMPSIPSGHSIKMNNVANRAQLTPLKN
jgi:hypothetical protein